MGRKTTGPDKDSRVAEENKSSTTRLFFLTKEQADA